VARQRVQSLDRALDLLEALSEADELGVSELASRTGLVPSTAHRLLATLVARGYAAQNPATGRYLTGFKLLELTSGLQDRLGRLRAAARPHL
jgi:DNA-binding IclR family transcriptional regulator